MSGVAAPRSSEPSARSARLTLLTASFGTLLVLVDYTSPLTTLTPTAASLGAGLTAQTWTLTGTLLGLAALLLTMGSAADDFGRKRVFGAGAVLMLLSTALSAAAPNTGIFLTGRVLQGCAGAALLAPSLGLVGHAFPTGPARIRATGVWGAAVGLGIAIGPVYAALLEKAAGWRAVYWVLALLSAVVLLLTVFGVEESRNERPRKLDPLGVLTLGAGASCLIAGLAEGRYGWGRTMVVSLLVAGVLLLAAFVVVESRIPEPMLDLALLRSPGFVVSCSGALFTGLSIVGLMSYLPTVLQKSLGQSPLAASGILAIWSGLSFVAALQARRLATRVSAISQVAASLLVCGIGEAALYGMHEGDSWARLVPGLAIAGIGSGVLNAALARLAVASVPAHRGSMGSGANNTARYLGSSLGVALTVTLVAQASSSEGPAEATALGANDAVLAAAALCLVGALISLWGRIAERRAERAAGEDAGPAAVKTAA
ncbi:MFS transporter [Streptomyces physcomitrii]|uniref:MFS transporter n=1 Tax=Streptomyces physcomitrii TaxID=2724184 RepID=A0ABX1GYI4_9ACTN|nr:MFS transporter [Streptomyces physcomitrii]NKI40124.1 MFS transporter [Streptomyces physcomitrii]